MTTGQIAIIVLILLGAGFMLISAIGIVRLPDVFSRMHAADKAMYRAKQLGKNSVEIARAGEAEAKPSRRR